MYTNFWNRNRSVPCAGLGTTVFWYGNREAEKTMAAALRNNEIAMVDCAEMYGNGRCERTVGQILSSMDRKDIYLIDKILPYNATPGKFRESFEDSCRRLGTDYIDLYLLHWREDADLSYVVSQMEQLKREGRIGEWGVSNFDTQDMEDLFAVQDGDQCFCDQILYNIGERGVEYDLLPWLRTRQVLPMAYSCLGSSYSNVRNAFENDPEIHIICQKEEITPSALMLSFVVHQGVSAIFSTASYAHFKENIQGLSFDITPYMDILNKRWPAPDHKVPLAKL